MEVLSLYWKCVWDGAIAGQPARNGGHTKQERRAFDRRMSALRKAGRRFVQINP